MGWATTLDVVVPVHNEERALPGCIEVLSGYLTDRFPLKTNITVVDNGSTGPAPTWRSLRGRSEPRRRPSAADARPTRGQARSTRMAWTSPPPAAGASTYVGSTAGPWLTWSMRERGTLSFFPDSTAALAFASANFVADIPSSGNSA